MKELEFKGADIDEAIKEASEKLNTTADNLEFEIVSLGEKGLFGLIGRKKAVIKVFVKDDNKKDFARDEKRHEKKPQVESEKRPPEKRPDRRPEKRHEKRPDRGSEKKSPPRENEVHQKPMKKEQPQREPEIEITYKPEDIAKIADYVSYILDKINDDVKVQAYTKKNKIIISIDSENSGKIIGKRGHIINSVEYLATKYTRKIFGEKRRVVLQIEDEKK